MSSHEVEYDDDNFETYNVEQTRTITSSNNPQREEYAGDFETDIDEKTPADVASSQAQQQEDYEGDFDKEENLDNLRKGGDNNQFGTIVDSDGRLGQENSTKEKSVTGVNMKDKPYVKPHNKPIFKGSEIVITPIMAKMYGLRLTDDGKISIPKENPPIDMESQVKSKMKRLNDLTNASSKSSSESNKKLSEATFQPQRSAEAERAMKNPRCGYDFINRLHERGEFLDRVFKKNEKSKADKALLDKEEQDYQIKLDKLSCPTCKKTQSFDEYKKRSRVCTQCNERFVQLHVANRSGWEKVQKERQERAVEKISKLEKELYDHKFAPTLQVSNIDIRTPSLSKSIVDKTKDTIREKEEKSLRERKEKEAQEKARKEQEALRAHVRVEALTKRILDTQPKDTLDALLQNLKKSPPPESPPKLKMRPVSAGASKPRAKAETHKKNKPKKNTTETDILEGFKKLIAF